jgi:thioredoxin reductase (NADPH)
MNEPRFDCIVIGGGPGGLTAAIYLARCRRHVAVFDTGDSRAAFIPRTHNYPGFAHGISGPDLLAALTEQARTYGVRLIKCEAETLVRDEHMFCVTGNHGELHAVHAIMATGLIDTRPEIAGFDPGADGNLVRYCPICDGYEAADKEICVFGSAADAYGKALFLRTFSKSVTLLTPDGCCSEPILSDLAAAGIRLPYGKGARLWQEAGKILARLSDGSELRFDLLYPVLGCAVRSELAMRLGASHTKVGCLIVDDHLQTTVPGLYAVGDIVSDLHQIAVATGHAAVAATHIHNSLPRNFR